MSGNSFPTAVELGRRPIRLSVAPMASRPTTEPAASALVTRERSCDAYERRAAQRLNQLGDGRLVDSFRADREEIPFSHQREKCESMLGGRGPQAESGIGAPRRHRCRNGAVRKLFVAVTDDVIPSILSCAIN